MADITKCANWHDCPKAETCYRCTAPDNEWGYQAYSDFTPETPWLCFYKREVERTENDQK